MGRSAHEVMQPRLLAMLCILAVFVPTFFLVGISRALFPPLALAVGFSMIASYLISGSLVPVLSVWLFRGTQAAHDEGRGFFARALDGYARIVAGISSRS